MTRPSLVQALGNLPPDSFHYRLQQVIGEDMILPFAHQVGIPDSLLWKWLNGDKAGG